MSGLKDCQNWVHVGAGAPHDPPAKGSKSPQRVDADTPFLSHVSVAVAMPAGDAIALLAGGCCYPCGGCNTPASNAMAAPAGVPKDGLTKDLPKPYIHDTYKN